MNKYFKALMGALVVVAVVAGCSSPKADGISKHIPKEADAVLALDMQSLALNLFSVKSLFSAEFWNNVTGGQEGEDLKATGLDLTGDYYLFLGMNDQRPMDGPAFTGIVGQLDDAAKFEAFVKDKLPDYKESQDGTLKIISVSGGDPLAIIFDDKTVIVASDLVNPANSIERAKSYFNLEKENSLAASNEYFAKILDESGEIDFWLDGATFAELGGSDVLQGAGLPFNVPIPSGEGTYTWGSVSFNTGNITLSAYATASKETRDAYGNIISGQIGNDILNEVPANDALALIGVSLSMNELMRTLKQANVLVMLDGLLQGMGMTADDLPAMLNGQIVLGVSEVGVKEDYYGNPEPDVENMGAFLLLGLESEDKANEMLSKLSEQGMIMQNEDGSYGNPLAPGAGIYNRGNSLLVAYGQSMVDNIGNGGLNSDQKGMLKGQTIGVNIDLTKMPDELVKELAPDGQEMPVLGLSVSGESYNSKGISSGEVVIELANKDKNALLVLAELAQSQANL